MDRSSRWNGFDFVISIEPTKIETTGLTATVVVGFQAPYPKPLTDLGSSSTRKLVKTTHLHTLNALATIFQKTPVKKLPCLDTWDRAWPKVAITCPADAKASFSSFQSPSPSEANVRVHVRVNIIHIYIYMYIDVCSVHNYVNASSLPEVGLTLPTHTHTHTPTGAHTHKPK